MPKDAEVVKNAKQLGMNPWRNLSTPKTVLQFNIYCRPQGQYGRLKTQMRLATLVAVIKPLTDFEYLQKNGRKF